MGRPSDGMTLDELREEFDWMTEFQSRMAERIRGDADVHSLVGYVGKLEAENAKLRERAVAMLSELRGVVSEGDYDSPSGHYFLLRRDVAAYEDALRELGIEVDE